MTPTMRSLVSLLLAAALTNACSFAFTNGPPPGHEKMQSFTCTETDAVPLADFLWAGFNVAGAFIVSSHPENYENATALTSVGLAWGVVSTASGITGLGRTSKCRAARARFAAGQPAGPQPGATLVQSVALTPQDVTLAVGQTQQLVAQAYHSSGVAIPTRDFTWSSSDDAIASVSSFGLVTAHAPGIVTIAARTGNLAGTTRILVVDARE